MPSIATPPAMPELEGVPRLVTAPGVKRWSAEGVPHTARYVEARKGGNGEPVFNVMFDVETDDGPREYLLVDPSDAFDIRAIELTGIAGVEVYWRSLAAGG